MDITAAERQLVLDQLQKMAYSTSTMQYDQLYAALQRSVPRSVLTYYNNNWHQIRHECILDLKFSSGSFMNTTNNHLERLNGQLKEVVQRYSSLKEFLVKFYIVLTAL